MLFSLLFALFNILYIDYRTTCQLWYRITDKAYYMYTKSNYPSFFIGSPASTIRRQSSFPIIIYFCIKRILRLDCCFGLTDVRVTLHNLWTFKNLNTEDINSGVAAGYSWIPTCTATSRTFCPWALVASPGSMNVNQFKQINNIERNKGQCDGMLFPLYVGQLFLITHFYRH